MTDAASLLKDWQTNPKVWISGPAGCGKTTAGADYLRSLIFAGVPAENILVLVPQRSLAQPYQSILRSPDLPSGGQADLLTLNSLAQRCISLFWPVIARTAGFSHPSQTPTFLTIETAQYHLASIVREKQEKEGYFAAVNLDPNRLYSQLLDNLNKSAIMGFTHTEIGGRLKSAWNGPTSQLRVYDQAQECIELFRQFCLNNNLLDFSLQMQVFMDNLWPALLCRQYLQNHYRHLIVDNLEEDTPALHRLIEEWLPVCDSAFLITDDEGGFRRFLGADPENAERIAAACPVHLRLEKPISTPETFLRLSNQFAITLHQKTVMSKPQPVEDAPFNERIEIQTRRFFPEMLDWAAETVATLIQSGGVDSGRIAVISPFLPDTLRFSLAQRLADRNIPYRTVRPSRSLQEEPVVQCLLCLAKLCHPGWKLAPHKQDVTFTLLQSIGGLDAVRASLLSDIVYRKSVEGIRLSGFDPINPKEKSRITYVVGEKYETFRTWIEEYQEHPVAELDIFFQRIFGELLTRPGFGFAGSKNAGEVTANLIESASKFRQNMQAAFTDQAKIGPEFVRAVEQGLVAAQFLRSYETIPESGVLIAPAHTFLMQNQPIDYQVWLDIGSNGWWERLEQPLTHPYVLSRSWPVGKLWTDEEEFNTNQSSLYRMIHGLLRRCNQKVYLLYLELNEQGMEQQGAFLKAFHTTLVRLQKQAEAPHAD
jgi:hypothetical protein